jgi:hypothetical protein
LFHLLFTFEKLRGGVAVSWIKQKVVAAVEAVITSIPLVGGAYSQHKRRLKADRDLLALYGGQIDTHEWVDNDYREARIQITCCVGVVNFPAVIECRRTPNGTWAALWPFADGALLPVTAENLQDVVAGMAKAGVEVILARTGYRPMEVELAPGPADTPGVTVLEPMTIGPRADIA